MPHFSPVSPATGQSTSSYYIHTKNGNFLDNLGNIVLFRGVNLCGDSKAPVGSFSHTLDFQQAEERKESFVGRPLKLEDADAHLSRLRGWGFNILRYVICWEALEHSGPGLYDEEFIDYTISVLRKCKEHGFRVFIDPHQDVWSRFCGGSGAPYWTLHACGLDPRNFSVTGSLIHSEWPHPKSPDTSNFPVMSWPTSYYKFPSQTMFTMFWAGKDLAPKCIIDGQNIQDYLQSHYIEAFGHLAERLRDAGGLLDECVIGWESMNEPSEGYIGISDLNEAPAHQRLKKEASPTPAQGIRLASGISQTVDHWSFSLVGPVKFGSVEIDPGGQTAWLDSSCEKDGVSERWKWNRSPEWKLGECVWAQHVVWDPSNGELLDAGYFGRSRQRPGKEVDFVEEYWLPHWRRWAARIRSAHPEAIQFVQPPLFTPPPKLGESDLKGRACYSPHFYDGLTMMSRHWNWYNSDTVPVLRNKLHVLRSIRFGEADIRNGFQEQFALFREDVQDRMGDYPVLVSETGTPFDVDEKSSYGNPDEETAVRDYHAQTGALDATLNAADGKNVYSWTIWSYCTDHTWKHGDGWNKEDLSIWSPDDYNQARRLRELEIKRLQDSREDDVTTNISLLAAYHNLTDGARAIKAFCRPFPIKSTATPTSMSYDLTTFTFHLTVSAGSEESNHATHLEEGKGVTEVYIPLIAFSALASGTATQEATSSQQTTRYGSTQETKSKALLDASTDNVPSAVRAISDTALEMNVSISEGEWKIHEQYLLWSYSLPEAGPAKEYHMTIRNVSAGSAQSISSTIGGGMCVIL